MSNSHSDTSTKSSRPSSFLDSFLSDKSEPDPYTFAPEDAKISDRSAFDKQNLSIEDIVSGSGVSSIANFPTSQPAPESRTRPAMPARQSAIPITPPKKFKGHNLVSFPDKPQRPTTAPPPKRQVQPTTYTTGTFSQFRSMSTQTRRYLSTTSPLNSAPHRIQRNQRSRQIKIPAAISTPTPIRSTPSPTEMSPNELLKNKEFRKLRWHWTGIIVGIPLLIVSSYHLYYRVDEVDREKKIDRELQAALAGEAEVARGPRQRGVLPGYENGKA